MDLRRKISQIFDSLYWYRWRHYKDNELLLPDTWNGSWSIYRVMYAKLEHMMYDFHKYSNEQSRYIVPNKQRKDLSDEEYKDYCYLVNLVLQNRPIDTRFYVGNISDEKSDDGKRTVYLERCRYGEYSVMWNLVSSAHKLIDPKTIKKKNKLYTLKENGEKFEFIEANQYNDVDTQYVNIGDEFDIDHFSDIIKQAFGLDVNVIDIILGFNAVTISPEDYADLSPTLKQCVRGKVGSYHEMWQCRKDFKKLLDKMYDDFNPDEKTKKKLRKEFIKIMSFIYDKGDHWWM